MSYSYFVGIDVSKATLDVCIIFPGSGQEQIHLKINNDQKAFVKLFKDISIRFGKPDDSWLFCLEHTGVYALPICTFLAQNNLTYTLVPALQIQKSLGIRRGKSDKSDSRDIALYAMKFNDQMVFHTLPDQLLQKLQLLLAQRERILSTKLAMQVPIGESTGFVPEELMKTIKKSTQRVVEMLEKELKKIEDELSDLIRSDQRIYKVFKLIISIPGVGPQTAYHLIMVTKCFTTFDNPRQLACYCGVAPFERTSGTSVRGKAKVSHLANKKLKTLLNMCALSAKSVDPQIAAYYQKKIQEGKHVMSVLNAIRNKLLHRIFAVVNRGSEYVKLQKC